MILALRNLSGVVFVGLLVSCTTASRNPAAVEARETKSEDVVEGIREATRSEKLDATVAQLRFISQRLMTISNSPFGAAAEAVLEMDPLVAKDGTQVRIMDIARAIVGSDDYINQFVAENFAFSHRALRQMDWTERVDKILASGLPLIGEKLDSESSEADAIIKFLALAPKVITGQVPTAQGKAYLQTLQRMITLLKNGKAKSTEDAWKMVQTNQWMQEQFGLIITDARVAGYEGVRSSDSFEDEDVENISDLTITLNKTSERRQGKWSHRARARVNQIENPLLIELESSNGYTLGDGGVEIALPSTIDLSKKNQVLESYSGGGGRGGNPFLYVTSDLTIGKDQITFTENTYNYGKGLGQYDEVMSKPPGVVFKVEMSFIKHEDRIEITGMRITNQYMARKTQKYVKDVSVEVILKTPFYISILI